MSESFDPYLKWFGIPTRDRPVHHYRLLAIELFEADAEVIENAADQRMAHLKRFNTGKHSALAEKLLNEVAAARVCLLNPTKKAKYDEELRERLAAQAAAVQEAAETPAVVPPPVMGSGGEEFLTQFETVPSSSQRPSRPVTKTKKKRTQTPWAVILAVAAGLAAVVFIAIVTRPQSGDGNGSRSEQIASASGKDGQDRPPASVPRGNLENKGADHGAEKTLSPPVAAGTENKPPVGPGPAPAVHPAVEPAVTPAASGRGNESSTGSVPPAEKPAVAAADTGNPPETPRAKPAEPSVPDLQVARVESRPEGEAKPPAKARPPAPAGPKKIPPPDAAAVKNAQQKLHDRYRWDLSNANSKEEKLRLVDRLVRDADNMHGDSTGRLVMLQEAVALARQVGETRKAGEVLDIIGQSYDINVVAIKVDMVQNRADEVAKAAAAPGTKGARLQQIQQASREVLDDCRTLTEAALDRGDVETAQRCLNIARPAAGRLKDRKTKQAIDSWVKDMEKLRKRLDEMQAAIASLRDKPDDPETNLTAGTWYCLVTGDWDTGLPYLAKGSDADLAEAAKKDLAGPSKPADQVTAGNLWWSLGDKNAGVEAVRLRSRAVHWYTLALPKVSGAVETKIRRRVDSMGSAGQYALEFDGRGSCVLFHNINYNGAYPITIEAVVKPSQEDNWGRSFLIGNGDRAGLGLGRDGNRWFFRVDTVVDARRGTDRIVTVNGAGGGNPWTHVAAVYDGREIRLYVDGHHRDSQRVNGQHKASGLPFVLGAWPPGGNKGNVGTPFKGLVRAVRISKGPLYNDDFVPMPLTNGPGTMALFTFTEGHGDRIKDTFGRKGFGEIQGAEWVNLADSEPHP